MEFPSLRTISLFGAIAGATLTAGCYAAEFDPNTDQVFQCFIDDDCTADATCESRVCVLDEGPEIEITGPEFLSALDEGVTTFSLTLRGSGLTLVEPGGEAVEGEGYIEVMIDGARILSAIEDNEISDGSAPLATGITVDDVLLPDLDRTVHRVTAQAFKADGTPYPNRSATARHLFFRNVADAAFTDKNGLAPQIAVLEPWPGQEIPATEAVTIAVAAINWDWAPPTTSAEKTAPDAEKTGHTHIYFNRDRGSVPDADVYPDCLPSCNLEYATTFNPDSAGTDNSQVLRGQVPLSEEFATQAELDVQVALQWNDHVPYPAPSNSTDDWEDFPLLDSTTTNVRNLFVSDQVQAELYRE